MVAAIFIGGSFIFATFAWYWMAVASGLLGVAAILAWLWVGTAEIPEKAEKAVGLGLTLPLYASGPAGVGWWAMFITLLGDAPALAGLVFGYFFLDHSRRFSARSGAGRSGAGRGGPRSEEQPS